MKNGKSITLQILGIAAICILSYFFFFYFTSKMIYRFYHGNSSVAFVMFIAIYIGQTVLMYTAADYVVEKKINALNLKILWAVYFLSMTFMLFGRSRIGTMINLDPRELFNTYAQNIELMIMNFIMFMPVGYLLKRWSWAKVLLFALLIVLSIETIQLISQRGIFDIDDIILNTAGIMFGYYLTKLKKCRS